MAEAHPSDLYWPEALWILHCAFEASGETLPAARALANARAWIEGFALPDVPEAFRHGFLHRQPVNRMLLAKARRAA